MCYSDIFKLVEKWIKETLQICEGCGISVKNGYICDMCGEERSRG
jgi:hypothetical protein